MMFGAGLFGALFRLYLLVLAVLIVAGLFATAFLMRLAWQHKLLTAAIAAGVLGAVAWLDWRDRRRWRRLLAAAAAYQAERAPPEGWPLPFPPAEADLAAVLRAGGLGGRLVPGRALRKAAEQALREGGAPLFARRFLALHPELAAPEAGRAAHAGAYARTFGADLRWAPYLHHCLEARFEVGAPLADTERLILQAHRRLRPL